MNYKQLYAKKAHIKERIRKLVPEMRNDSGVYTWWRVDENGYTRFYSGQAKHLVDRSVQHVEQYDRLGLSIVKHGLANEKADGWHLNYEYASEDELNDLERETIAKMMAMGNVITYNVTSGGQDKGKTDLTERKQPKGYYDGKRQGYIDARRLIAKLFDKHLTVAINGKQTIPKLNALKKFEEFINITGEQDDG